MKIFSTSQVRSLDAYSIVHEPIASIDLMERAADMLVETFYHHYKKNHHPILIFAGAGNNGGDALAFARKLLEKQENVKLLLLHNGNLSNDCEINKQRLKKIRPEVLFEQTDTFNPPEISTDTIIVDGLFGAGLTRALSGIFAEAVQWINAISCEVLSIDIPSGLQGEENTDLSLPIIKANRTFSLQFPKLSFLFPETSCFVGNWEVLDIGIHPEIIERTETPYYILQTLDIKRKLKVRTKFSHKGSYGHAIIFAGSKDMAGAAVLSAEAALRTGAGLVTVQSAACNRVILQTTVPEAIFLSDKNKNNISILPDLEKYNAVAIGPGIGTSAETTAFLQNFLKSHHKASVLDADALNIMALHKEMLSYIPAKSILTPHQKEFERLFGKSVNSFEQMQMASQKAQKLKTIIVLKGAHTQIFFPDGKIIFNNTGNNGMATGGSGDVLTGMLVGLLAQGYKPEEATMMAVYLHGLAGDLALQYQTEETLLARDIISTIKESFEKVRDVTN